MVQYMMANNGKENCRDGRDKKIDCVEVCDVSESGCGNNFPINSKSIVFDNQYYKKIS